MEPFFEIENVQAVDARGNILTQEEKGTGGLRRI
jgi:hypothetical protein